MTWVRLTVPETRLKIEADPRHREILLAQMNLDGANVKFRDDSRDEDAERNAADAQKIHKDRVKIRR